MLAGVAVLRRCGGDAQFLADDLQDGDSSTGHEPRLSPMTRLMCRLSDVAYVVDPGNSQMLPPVHQGSRPTTRVAVPMAGARSAIARERSGSS